MAYSTKNTSFFRLATLILDPGTRIVKRKLNLKITDTGLTFVQFISNRKHDLFHLYKKSVCCLCSGTNGNCSGGITTKQWQELFIQNGKKCNNRKHECICLYNVHPKVKVDDLDISFAVCLLIHLCPLSPAEKQDLKNLRDQRNKYFAHANTPKIDTMNFSKTFQDVASTIESIANSCGHETRKEFTEIIQQIKEDPIDRECFLPLLYQSKECTQEEIHEMKTSIELSIDKLDEVHRDIKQILQNQSATPRCTCIPPTPKESVESYPASKEKRKIPKAKPNGQDSKDDPRHTVKLKMNPRQSGVKRQSSETLPARIKNQGFKPGPLNDETDLSFHDLKSEEQQLLSSLIETCKTGDLKQVSSIASDLPEDCKFIHVRDRKGYCAIHHTANRDGTETVDIIKELISRGAKITDTTSDGMTVLHIACKTGNIKLCEFCISVPEDLEIINKEDNSGWNSLLYAAFCGHTDILKFLSGKHRKVNLKSSRTNENILHLACLGCHIETCKYIMRTFPEIVHEVDHERRNIMQYTARGGETKIMNHILKKIRKTRNSLLRPSKGGRNPLHIACLYGKVEMSRKIISKFPSMLHETDDEDLHAVHYAAVGGHVAVMELLMEFLRDKIKDYYVSKTEEINILQMACVYDNADMWCFIAENFPELITVHDTDGWAIVHVAARSGNVTVLKKLADDKSQDLLSMADSLGRSVLHIGCLYGKYKICEFLVSKYPSMINMKDVDDCRPVVLAAAGGNLDILKLLLDNESETTVTTTDRFTILQAACMFSHSLVICYIEEKYPALRSRMGQNEITSIEVANYVESCEMECFNTESARRDLLRTDESTSQQARNVVSTLYQR